MHGALNSHTKGYNTSIHYRRSVRPASAAPTEPQTRGALGTCAQRGARATAHTVQLVSGVLADGRGEARPRPAAGRKEKKTKKNKSGWNKLCAARGAAQRSKCHVLCVASMLRQAALRRCGYLDESVE